MTQKEEKLDPRYGIMKLLQTISHKKGGASHEYDNTRSKETSSSS